MLFRSKGYKELADLIIEDQKVLKTDAIASAPAVEWYKESQELHSKVYIDGSETLHPFERQYCMRLIKDANGKPEVDSRGIAKTVKATGAAEATPEYMQEASEIIKGRIMKAGLRLAYVINKMGQEQYLDGGTEYQSKKVKELAELLKEFENKK